MTKCSFCGKEIAFGTGKMFVLKNGTVKYFCANKCERNWQMKRDPKKLKWTEFFQKGK